MIQLHFKVAYFHGLNNIHQAHKVIEDEMNLSKFLLERDEDQEFYTRKEVKPRIKNPDFGLRRRFEKEGEITPKDMPDLESEESAEPRGSQNGQRLKIVTPDQMLGSLPICYQFEKLKYETKQFMYLSVSF